ncbi:hypothetical protein J6590_105721 [Homalodisca vitripennis]|nr:hypothetical protein J6590_105721 [Homalodisca vitripennis]
MLPGAGLVTKRAWRPRVPRASGQYRLDKAVQTISAAHVLTALWVLQTERSVLGQGLPVRFWIQHFTLPSLNPGCTAVVTWPILTRGPSFGSVSGGGVGQGAFNSNNLLNSPRPIYLVSVADKEGKGRFQIYIYIGALLPTSCRRDRKRAHPRGIITSQAPYTHFYPSTLPDRCTTTPHNLRSLPANLAGIILPEPVQKKSGW